MTLRPVDLARHVGVSTQQIRNHEAAGVLPPTTRTPTGHRVYGREHLDALLAFRALDAAAGRETATAIMRSLHALDLSTALRRLDRAHADLHAARQATEDTAAALEAVADTPTEDQGPLRIGDVAGRLSIRPSALRVWEFAGLLHPAREKGTGYRTYTALDLRDARVIATLRAAGYPFARIAQVLAGLRESGDSAALRLAITERRAAQDAQSRGLLRASAHLHAYIEGD
ncbi:MerR family transcriptional regulator [Actinokineospora pegani]|uniref:MerR family transcriptional regulator n=1 Tax=Actinokineospora pegani TaxID=2654637 RepID=UPI0012EA0C0D|nr:MerR family transcriptional regulator [Actinokineospora pegani]